MIYDNIVIGGGPSGIQMAYFLSKTHESYVVLEQASSVASFFQKYPLNRKLISFNKTHCGAVDDIQNVMRYDWNSLLTLEEDNFKCMFRDFSQDYYPHADDLVDYLNTFCKTFQLNIQLNTTVKSVSKYEGVFRITTTNEDIKCKRLFIASGLQPRKLLNIRPAKVVYYEDIVLDAELYKNKNILVIGGGNAAFEIANFVVQHCNKLHIVGAERLAYDTHYPGNLRSINFPIMDSAFLKMGVFTDFVHTEYARNNPYIPSIIQDAQQQSMYDIILCCVGFAPNVPATDINISISNFPILSPFFESTTCSNLYFLGALSQQHDYKHGTSAFIHGFRYNCRTLYRELFHQHIYSQHSNIDEIVEIVIKQINEDSCLFHKFDYVGDYILVTPQQWIYIQALPLSLMTHTSPDTYFKSFVDDNDSIVCIIQVYLGYNHDVKFSSKFNQVRYSRSVANAHKALFLHPRLQFWTPSWDPIFLLRLPENIYNDFRSHLYLTLLHLYFHVVQSKSTNNNLVTFDDLHALASLINLKEQNSLHTEHNAVFH